MGARSSIIEKLLGAFLLGAFVLYVIPAAHFSSFIGVSLLILGVTVISFAMARLLSGESDRRMLIVVALVVVAEALLLTLTPIMA